MLNKAIQFAKKAHEGQILKFNGEPFYNHVDRVLRTVIAHTDNEDLQCASVLHDVIERCNIQSEQLEYEFNLVVAAIVTELTNIYTKKAYPNLARKERKLQEMIRIGKISSSSKLIKLADRIDKIENFKRSGEDCQYYLGETRQLLEVLSGVDYILEDRLRHLVY
jgi:(p)ppGpp synthase/HD superfamily hydrolase